MKILAIDPGLSGSHAVLLEPLDLAPHRLNRKYRILSAQIFPGLEQHNRFTFSLPSFPDLIVVESARGEIAGGRSADPVLRNAAESGRIVGACRQAYECLTLELPSSSAATGIGWRNLLGIRASPIKKFDVDTVTRLVLEPRLEGEFPRGPRGAIIGHYWDAAGLGIATMDRLLERGITARSTPFEIRDEFYALSVLEQAAFDARKQGTTVRRKARAAQ